MFCANCGFKLNQENVFCPSCGIKQDPEMAPVISDVDDTAQPPSEALPEQYAVQQTPVLDSSARLTSDSNPQQDNSVVPDLGDGQRPQEPQAPQPADSMQAPVWKKIAAVSTLLFLVLVIVLVSVLASPVNRYKQAYKNNDLSRMYEIYSDSILGNDANMEKIRIYFESEADKVLENYEKEEITYEEALQQLEFIANFPAVSMFYLDEIFQRLYYLDYSYNSFQVGEKSLKDKAYQEAIYYFEQVGEDTKYFKDAQDKLTVAREAYRDDVLARVDGYINSGNISSAINELDHAIANYLSNDSQIVNRRNELQAQLEQATIQAILADIESFGDSKQALLALHAALNDYPGNESLSAAIHKYNDMYVDDVLAAAGEYAAQNKLQDAMEFLINELERVQEPRLEAALEDYQGVFVQAAIEESEKAFQEQKNYEAAFSIINNAVALLPGNQDLQNKKTDLTERMPIFISDLDYFDMSGNISINRFSEMKDNFENKYSSNISFQGWFDAKYVEYLLNYKYSTFTGVVALPYEKRDSSYGAYFKILGDGILLFESERVTRGSRPQEFSLDISGIEILRVEYEGTDVTAALYDGTLIE